MPSDPLMDIESLLAPIPGDSPAGGPVPFMLRQQFEELRQEVDPDEFDPDDPRRPESPKDADWPAIIALAQETLTTTSKDLLVAARLTEALTRQHGFGGLRDGLQLLRLLVERCWDRVNPPIESEDDLEVRAGPFHWLDDADRGARFPNTVRMVPMVPGEDGPISWYDWKRSQSGSGTLSPTDFEEAVQRTPRSQCQDMVDDLSQAWSELDTLTQELGTRMGQYAPGLTSLRQTIGECRTLAQQILQRKGPDPAVLQEASASGTDTEEDGATAPDGLASVDRHVASRDRVYRQLTESAALLRRLEPHSPIPYLLERAVELGALSFPELMKALIRDSDVLGQMSRELGIRMEEEE